MQPSLALVQTVLTPSLGDLNSVAEVDLKQCLERHLLRPALDQCDVIDPKAFLKRRESVESFDYGIWVEASFQLND